MFFGGYLFAGLVYRETTTHTTIFGSKHLLRHKPIFASPQCTELYDYLIRAEHYPDEDSVSESEEDISDSA